MASFCSTGAYVSKRCGGAVGAEGKEGSEENDGSTAGTTFTGGECTCEVVIMGGGGTGWEGTGDCMTVCCVGVSIIRLASPGAEVGHCCVMDWGGGEVTGPVGAAYISPGY